MAKLIELSPCDGLLPLVIGSVTLSEVAVGPVTSVAPFRGREGEANALLQAAFGFGFPAPNGTAEGGGARILWAGRGRALILGGEVPAGMAAVAAVTDQSDSSAIVSVAGRQSEALLARLVPLDLRQGRFATGATARTFVNHMTAQVTRTGGDAFEIMVFRSMAGTLVHELQEVARALEARRTVLS